LGVERTYRGRREFDAVTQGGHGPRELALLRVKPSTWPGSGELTGC
jgi:hypothetical protein